jgi:UDP-glucose 4-epimerase
MAETVLLTGPTGKIGANMAQHLLQRGYRLRLMSMPDDPQAERLRRFSDQAEVVAADLTDSASLQAAVQGVDAVVHLASYGHAAPSDYAFFHADVEGTYHLLQAVQARPALRRFVSASSYTVYGTPRYQPTDEHCPREPTSTLGLVKLVGETLGQAAWRIHGVPTVALRFTHVMAGPDILSLLEARRMIGRLPPALREQYAHHAADGSTFMGIRDEAGQPWTLHVVDVRDIVQCLMCALESDGAPGEVFNVAGPSPLSTVEAARYLAQALDRPYVEVTAPYLQRQEISTARARALIGYRPYYDFQRMAESAIAFQRGEDIGVIFGTWPR